MRTHSLYDGLLRPKALANSTGLHDNWHAVPQSWRNVAQPIPHACLGHKQATRGPAASGQRREAERVSVDSLHTSYITRRDTHTQERDMSVSAVLPSKKAKDWVDVRTQRQVALTSHTHRPRRETRLRHDAGDARKPQETELGVVLRCTSLSHSTNTNTNEHEQNKRREREEQNTNTNTNTRVPHPTKGGRGPLATRTRRRRQAGLTEADAGRGRL